MQGGAKMPGRDRSGPHGRGSGSGKGMGRCSGINAYGFGKGCGCGRSNKKKVKKSEINQTDEAVKPLDETKAIQTNQE